MEKNIFFFARSALRALKFLFVRTLSILHRFLFQLCFSQLGKVFSLVSREIFVCSENACINVFGAEAQTLDCDVYVRVLDGHWTWFGFRIVFDF